MRYLVTRKDTDLQLVLGYDRGLLSEVTMRDVQTAEQVRAILDKVPLQEEDVNKGWRPGTTVRALEVTFQDFWIRYAYKEGKKDAMIAWDRMPMEKQQRAFDHIRQYQDRCRQDGKRLLHPASYLRAERWLDHT